MIVIWLVVFLFGLAIGSFLNVVVYRLLHGGSPLAGRSKCPYCKKKIAWYDNIPLVSFAVLRGSCRNCGKKISWQYPALELITGMLFVWWWAVGRFFFRLSQQPYTVIQPVFWLMVGVGFAAMTVADLFYGVLPDLFTLGIIGLTLVYRVGLTFTGIIQPVDLGWFLLSGFAAGGFFWALVKITRGKGMGWGDVKLAVAMGLVLGWPRILVAVWLSFLTGAATGIILILVGKKRFGQTIPFGPFMSAGTAAALIWGEKIWQYYLNLLV